MSMQIEPADADAWRPGNQAERTATAWVRTSLSMLVSAAAAARLAAVDGLLLVEGVAGFGAASCLASTLLWWRRFRRSGETPGLAREGIAARSDAMTAAVVGVCAVGMAVSLIAGWALLD